MKLVTLDPSIIACGWAVLDLDASQRAIRVDSGTFHPSTAVGTGHRVDQLFAFVSNLVRRHAPSSAAVEEPEGYQKRSFAQLSIYCRAVAACECGCYAAGVAAQRVGVNAWKGFTKKGYAALIVSRDLGYITDDHNESDALALGLWWYATAPYRDRVAVAVGQQTQRRFPFKQPWRRRRGA